MLISGSARIRLILVRHDHETRLTRVNLGEFEADTRLRISLETILNGEKMSRIVLREGE
jgi:hypothetical protein